MSTDRAHIVVVQRCDKIIQTTSRSYNWQPAARDRYRRLSRLVETLFSHLAQLQQPPFHPKWRELALRATVAGWTRVRPAQEWLDHNALPAVPTASVDDACPSATEDRFHQFLDERAAARGPAASTPEGHDAIFREFLQWQASVRR
ncbi:MAG TPA: hypothetical protein VK281_20200 [Xanthobacteraceae bacterium]|nr:hypothetical protein [Xanthobacteraceae bacterium]